MSGNKKVSQLVELFASDVVSDDLLLIIDTARKESKKIKVSNFAAFLNNSGSIFAIHSVTADTASYILGSNVIGNITSASYALKSTNSSTASYASFALNSSASSYAQTSSWAVFSTNGGTSLVSGSTYNITSSWANNTNISKTASFLLYTGGNNGTASYSIKTANVINADTASFLNNSLGTIATSSYAGHAVTSDTSINSNTASFLQYGGFFNGTASFALNTSTTTIGGSKFNDYGLFLATSQSANEAQIDTVSITPSATVPISTLIEAIGSATLNFTSSIRNNDSISLSILDRITGNLQTLDTIPVFFSTTTVIDNWNSLLTGSISTPFLLASQITGSGSFTIEVNTTPNIILSGSRITKFNISSTSDIVSSQSDEIIDFAYDPTGSYAIFYSGSTGPFTDNLFGLRITGSQFITSMSLVNQNITNIRYTWKAIRLKSLDCSFNIPLSTLTYKFPDILNTLICNSCSLNKISSISNTSMSYFDCSHNFLNSLPDLPQTNYSMSYFDCSRNLISRLPTLAPTMSVINCSGNPLITLPSTFPFGLQKIFCDTSSLVTVLSNFPNSVISMSFQKNSGLQSWLSPFSSSLKYFNGSLSPLGVGGFPLPNISMSAILLQSSSLPALGLSSSMNAICSQSLFNAQNYNLVSGTIDITGNGFPDFNTLLNYINPLVNTYSWTVLHD